MWVLSKTFFRARAWNVLSVLLMLICLGFVLITFRDYGIGWDEGLQYKYGDYAIQWYVSGFTNQQALHFFNLMYYGAFFEMVAQAATYISPFGLFETRHLVTALFGLLGLLGAMKAGRALKGPAGGFFAALFLALSPFYWGNSFFNSKDIPFAALSVISLYYIVRWISELPRPTFSTGAKLALATGLTMAVRIGGILLVGYAALGVCVWLFSWCIRPGKDKKSFSDFLSLCAHIGLSGILIFVGAWAVMTIFWPYAQIDPIGNPFRSLQVMSSFPPPYPTLLFDRQLVPLLNLPKSYVPRLLLISLPEFMLLAAIVSIPTGIVNFFKLVKTRQLDTLAIVCILLVFAVMLPAVMVATHLLRVYDGLRHLLYIYPLMAVFASISVVAFVEHAFPIWIKGAFLALISVSLISTTADCIQLHPYESLYYNRTIGGGLQTIVHTDDTDYWGISLKEAAEWLVQNYPKPANGEKVKVAGCGGDYSISYFLPADQFEYVGGPDTATEKHADIILGILRMGCYRAGGGTVIHVIARQNAPLVYIKALAK